MLNFNPKKTDLHGSYLPSMRQGSFVWDVIMDNMLELKRYEINAQFFRWGWHPKMREIDHKQNKELDFYFFGMLSERRKALLESLSAAGLRGAADHSCPYFVRNSQIARAKVQLNLIQEDKYSHVNSFRICYLANNFCCTVSESENDPANYLEYAHIAESKNLVEAVQTCIANDAWRGRSEAIGNDFQRHKMGDIMMELLDLSFEKESEFKKV